MSQILLQVIKKKKKEKKNFLEDKSFVWDYYRQ